MEYVQLTLEDVRSLAAACLSNNGCDAANSAAVADTITAAERDLCRSHGLFRLPGYVASLRSGKVNGRARPRCEELAPGVLRVQGDRGFAPLAHSVGRQPLIERARSQGIAAVALVDIHHFSALWIEVEPLTEAGLCAFAFTSYLPSVAPAGGSKPVFGTNPMCFGWPREGQPPLVFDQASAARARGEVAIAAREGRELPPGVGLDVEGRPTTDPAKVLEGALLPFGGYKGSAIALMVELLAGPLVGEPLGFEAAAADNKDGGPPRGGELMLALDPARFGDPQGFAAHAERMFAKMLEQPGVRLPSARRYAGRERTRRECISVDGKLYRQVLELSETRSG